MKFFSSKIFVMRGPAVWKLCRYYNIKEKGDHHACMTNFYIPDGPLYVRQLVHEDAHLASKRTRKGLQKASEDEAWGHLWNPLWGSPSGCNRGGGEGITVLQKVKNSAIYSLTIEYVYLKGFKNQSGKIMKKLLILVSPPNCTFFLIWKVDSCLLPTLILETSFHQLPS